MMLTAAFAALAAEAALTVTGVTARQRWPWNSLVDVDFTVNGNAGEAYAIDISATAAGGDKKLCATSFETEPIAASGKRTRIVWNLGADYPNFKADDLEVTVTATPFSDSTPVYLVVDISGGTSAASWPVRYTTAAPVHTVGQNDPCKTTELWLKRVKAGMITMGSGSSNTATTYPSHTCTLTEDYYLGVFALTQAQSFNISGSYYATFSNELYRATRPVDSIKPTEIRSPYFNSASPDAAVSGGLAYNLRQRTGLDFDCPTSWQWEYACRAGSTSTRYEGCTTDDFRHEDNSRPSSEYEWYSVQGMWSEDYGTSYVDRYAPNPWGFYGMIGNVAEWCNDNRDTTIVKGDELTNPKGATGGGRSKAAKGGNWGSASTIGSNTTSYNDPWNSSGWKWIKGARICLTIKKSAE